MERILLVDDDRLFLDSMVNVLSLEDYEVDKTVDGLEAIQKLQSQNYDLAILDFNMQPLSGLDLLKHIRSQNYDCAVIMVTAFGSFEFATKALESDVNSILSKPFEMKQLISSVKKSLQHRVVEKKGHILEVQQEEIKKMSYLLRISHNDFQTLFDSITDPVMLFDADLKVVGANKAAIKKLGLEKYDILDKSYDSLFHTSTPEEWPAYRTLLTGLPSEAKMYDSQNERLYQVSAYPIFGENEEEVKKVVEFRKDITEISEMEERLKRADNMNSTAEMGHEMKNMITAIYSHVNLTKAYLKKEKLSELDMLLGKINKGMRRLITFTNKLMDNDTDEREVIKIKLVPFMDSLLDYVKPQSIFSSIQFQRHWNNHDVAILGNEIQLQQVFINLLKNSAEAMKEGTISIKGNLIENNTRIQIIVSDNGPGIATEVISQIFHSRVTTKEYGHGFGLMITKKLVQQNEGTIKVESNLNKGADFILTFPILKNTEKNKE